MGRKDDYRRQAAQHLSEAEELEFWSLASG